MKHKRKILTISLGIISMAVVILISNIVVHAISEKTLIDIFFTKENEKNKDYLNELLIQDGRSIEIDGYTFTLMSELYDASTGSGYFNMTVTSDEWDISEMEYTDSSGIVYFGDNKRFSLRHSLEGFYELKLNLSGDKLEIAGFITNNVGKETYGKIKILDFKNEPHRDSASESAIAGEFELADSGCHKTVILNDKITLYCSPFVIKVVYNDNKVKDINDMSIVMVNDEEIKLITDGQMQPRLDTIEGAGRDGSIQEETYVFTKVIDIRDIDYFIINNEKYDCEEKSREAQ